MYLNTPGGQQYSIMAVIDMMNTVKCDVSTVAFGNVAQEATLVLTSGAKGKAAVVKKTTLGKGVLVVGRNRKNPPRLVGVRLRLPRR